MTDNIRYAFSIQDATLKTGNATDTFKRMGGGEGTISCKNNVKAEYRDECTGELLPQVLVEEAIINEI